MNGMQKGRKRTLMGWIGLILAGLLALIVLLAGAVLAGGTIISNRLRATTPTSGEMVDVGGLRLHLHCKGKGSPTVIVIAGSGVSSPYYSLVQSGASQSTRVCLYDRPGYAWSEASNADLSPDAQVRTLSMLLQAAGIQPPYILAGHSYGGYIGRLFAQTYPDEVAGLVMIDSAHEEQYVSFPEPLRESARKMFGADNAMTLLLARLIGSLQAILPGTHPMLSLLPPETGQTLMAAQKMHTDLMTTIKAEARPLAMGTAPKISHLGDLPMIVITHGVATALPGQTAEVNAGFEEVNIEMQQRLLALSSRARQIIAHDSNHDEIPIKQADLVVEAILEVIRQTSTSG